MDVKEYAVIVFCDKEKRILLQDRKGISKYGEEWGFFGGKLEGSETPEAGIIRETKEELDYDLASFKFFTRVQAPSASGRGRNGNAVFLRSRSQKIEDDAHQLPGFECAGRIFRKRLEKEKL